MADSEPRSPRVAAPGNAVSSSPSFLDVLLIVSFAMLVDLVLLWVAGQIKGIDLLDELAPWMIKLGVSLKAGLVALGTTTVLALLKQFLTKTDYKYYLRDTLVVMAVLLVCIFLATPLLSLISPHPPQLSAVQPQLLTMRIKGLYDDGREATLDRQCPLEKPPDMLQTIAFQAKEVFPYKQDVTIPSSGIYVANIFSSHGTAEKGLKDSTQDYRADYQICLQRNPVSNPSLKDIRLKCTPGKFYCELDDSDPGWVLPCHDPKKDAASTGNHGVVYAAEAQRDSIPVWVAPILDTLRNMKAESRPGYAVFTIEFVPSARVKDATYLTYQVSANGTPVYFDKIPTDLLREPVSRQGPTKFSFALENLDFSGASRGVENLTLQVGLFGAVSPVYQTISRQYVALRPAAPVMIPTSLGTFRWSAEYIDPPQRDRWEVIVNSTPATDDVDRLKRLFDARKLSVDGQPLVLVVRPPLLVSKIHTSKYFALALGEVQTNGQVRFTFDDAESNKMCTWALAHESTVRFIHKGDARRETIDDQRVQFCRDLPHGSP